MSYVTSFSIAVLALVSLTSTACSMPNLGQKPSKAASEGEAGRVAYTCTYTQTAGDGHEDFKEVFELAADQKSYTSKGGSRAVPASIERVMNVVNTGEVPAVIVQIRTAEGIEASTDYEESVGTARIVMRVLEGESTYTHYLSCRSL